MKSFYEMRDDTNYLIGFFSSLNKVFAWFDNDFDADQKKRIKAELKNGYQTAIRGEHFSYAVYARKMI